MRISLIWPRQSAAKWTPWIGVLAGTAGSCAGLRAAQGYARELDPVGAREQAVADGIGDGRFAQALVPEGDRELAGDDGRAEPRPVLDHLEQAHGEHLGDAAFAVFGLATSPFDPAAYLAGSIASISQPSRAT